ncbi:hypothetical protein D8B22_19235, partial [Verminephrobacter aporrectodeae subsp. tuberculatae]
MNTDSHTSPSLRSGETTNTGGTQLPTLAATNPITIGGANLGDAKLSIGESTTVTIRFAEAIAIDSFTTADLRVGGGATLSNLRSTDGGTTWTVTLKVPGVDDVPFGSITNYNSTGNQIRVDLTGVTNLAGNAGVGQAVSTVTYDIDTIGPGTIITLGDSALTVGETTTVTFSLSEPVTSFTAANIDLTRTNGTLGPLTALGDGRTWTATFTPTANINTTGNSIGVRSLTDLAGNTSGASFSDNYSIDTRPGSTGQTSGLSASVTLTDSRLTTGEKATVIIAFNKPVTGFTLDDVDGTHANGTLSDLTLSADGRTWTATFTPTAGVIDETNTISVNLAGVTDAAGTAGTGRVTSSNFIVTTALPAATITLTDTALTAGETTTVTFSFNQVVRGFMLDDIDLTQANGTLSELVYIPDTGNKTWTATFTPKANFSNASNTISVNLTGVANVAGRSGTGSASSENYTVDTRTDTTPPAFSSAAVNGSQLVLTYTEANTLDPAALAGSAGFTVSSTTGTAITVSGAVVHATNKTVTLTLSRAVTPAETVKVSYTKPASGAVVQDAAGNDAVNFSEQAVTNNSPPAAGGTRLPTLAATNPITIADDKLSVGESTTVTIRFAEAIATDSFTIADLTVGGYAKLSNLQSTDGGTTWTVTLTAPGVDDFRNTPLYDSSRYNSTGNHISVNLANVTNPAGTAGVGRAVSTVTYDIDVWAPGVTIRLGDSALTAGETTTVTISFNEPVEGFDAADIDLSRTDGTVGPLTALGDGRTWTTTFTPTANINTTTNSIGVNLRGVTDLAGNTPSASSFSDNYSIDTRPGSTGQTSGLSASVTLTDDRLTTGEKATVIIAFNKPVANFTIDDVDGTHANGTLSDLVRSADGRTWTATFTPTAGVIAENNTISVNLAGVTDAAGTAATGRTTSDNFIVHTALPAATITLADTALTAGETTTVTFRFNQVVFGFTMDDIVLDTATGTLGALTTTDNQTWTATLTPKADVSAATNTIRVNLTGVANVAGRSSTGTADSANYTVDTRLPDTTPPAFSSAAVNGSQLVITYTEANSLDAAALAGNAGFTVSSTTGTAITVSGAVVHATNKTVTLTLSRAVTPAETVKVSYTKPASGAVVQDAAGNDAVSFSEQAVTNNTPGGTADTTAPQLITTGHEYQFPTVNRSGEQLLLTFSDTSNLDENHMPAARDFTVRVDGDLRTVSSVTMNATAKIIFLVLATPVAAGQRVTVAYQDSTPTDTEGNGIQDTAGNRLDSFPATEAVNSVLDTGAPQLITTGAMRPTASGNQLVLSFSDANGLSVDPARKPATGDFAVLVAGVANAVTAVAVNATDKTITLTLTTAVTPGQTATVAYADSTPNDISAIQDAQGNRLTGFAVTEVNTTPDTTPPVFSSAAVNGTQLVLTYTEANTLDPAALPGNAGFTVSSTTGTAITVSGAVVHATNKTVTLTLSRAVTPAETVKVSYTKPASGAVVQDAAGNDATNLSEQAVTNNTPNPNAPQLLTTGIHRPALDGSTIFTIRFSATSNLDERSDHAPAKEDFKVFVDGVSNTVRGVVVSGPQKNILLELTTPVVAGQRVTVAYQDSTPNDDRGIRDTADNRLASFQTTDVFNNALDNVPPQLITTGATRPTASGNQLVLSFRDTSNLHADLARKPATGDFTVRVADVANAVTAVAVNATDKTITLTLTTAVTPGQTATVAYTDSTPDDTSAIQDERGNRLTGFAATEVNTPDTTPPVFSSAAVNGTQLVISYTEANTLDPAALAGSAGFTVSSTTGTAITVSGAVVHATDKTVTLTLSRAVTQAETVKVSYTKPASGAVVQDAAGNDAVSFSEQAVTNTSPPAGGGTRLPTLAATNPITIADDKLSLGESTTVTIRFAEAIATDSFTIADLTVGGYATLANDLRSTDGGITWTVTLTAPTMEVISANPFPDYGKYNSTGNQVRVNLAGVTNSAGTAGVGQAVSTVTYDIDIMPPGVTIRLGDTVLTPGETTTVTFSFNEPVTGFDADDIDLTRANGTLGPLTAIGDDRRTWTATFTPAANVNAAENKIRVRLDGVADLAGNSAGTNSTSVSSNYTIDTRPGTTGQISGLSASVTLTDDRLTTGEKATVIIVFNKPVNGFTLDDVDGSRANGTLSGLILGADGRTWTATFTPTAGIIAESNTISVNLAGVTDAAGTAGTGSATSDNFRVHTALPAATITLADTALTAGETTTVTFRFNQVVFDFTMDDIVLDTATGTLGALTTTDNQTWTATFTPEANVSAATNTIRVNLTGVVNLAGRSSIGTASSANYTVDTRLPDATPPAFSSAAVNGSQLVLTYTEAGTLDAATLAGSAGFTVSSTTGTAITVSGAVVHATNKTVTLTLSRAVTPAETVKVSYTKPASGAVVQDAAGNDAVSFSEQAVTNNTPADTTPPEFHSATVTGTQLVISYTEANALDGAVLAGNAGYAVNTAAGTAAITVSSAVVNATAKTVTLTLSRAVARTETVSLSYTKPESGAVVQDAAGNDAANFSDRAVTNNTSTTPAPADTTPPEFHSATVTGAQLVLTYTEAGTLDAAALAGNAGFTVNNAAGTTAITVSSAVVNATAKTVTLTLSRAVAATETVTVSYTKPESGAVVQDAAGNDAVSFSAQAVTNNSPPADTTPPVLRSAAVNGDQLLLTFSEPLDGSSRPPVLSAFVVSVVGDEFRNSYWVSAVAVNGPAGTITLTLAKAVTPSQVVRIGYEAPHGGRNEPWGVIQDVAGNDAATFGGQPVTNNTAAAADTTPPAFSSAAVNGSQLVLTYTEANTLDPAALAGSAGFTVSSTTGTAITVSGAVVHATDKTVTLTLSRAVTPTETVKVSYTKPASGAVVQDAAGNDAVSFSDQAVTNNTSTDTTPPRLITTGTGLPTLTGDVALVIRFSDTSDLDEDLDHAPASGDFTVLLDGARIAVRSVTVDGRYKYIQLVLDTPITPRGKSLTIAYQDSTPTGGKGIQDIHGNRLDSFLAAEVFDNTTDIYGPQLITTGAKRPTASGNQLVLSFSDANNLSVDPTRKPVTGDFTVRVAGVANAVTAVAVDGAAKTITLTLTTAVTPGQTTTVAYADSTPNDISAIQDAQGNRLTGFAATEVNTTPDTTPPVFSSAAVNGSQLVLTYTEANTLDAAALAGSAGFTVSSSTGTAITVSSAVVNGADKTVTLTLSRAVTQAETVK